MYCKNCGKEIDNNAAYCPVCGVSTNGTVQNVQHRHGASCSKCHGHNITYQTVTEAKKTGCFTVLLYILLACTVLGLLIVIPLMLRKKTETITYAVCQDCGHRWRVN